MTISIRDKGLQNAFKTVLDDSKVTKAEVDKLIQSANDGAGLSKTERKDLEKILAQAGDKFDADAKTALQAYLGVAPEPGPVEPVPTTTSKYAATLTKLEDIVPTFKKEFQERAAEFTKPEDAFKLFAEYGGKLKGLGTGVDPRELDKVADTLLAAGRQSPAKGYDAKDSDYDTRSDLHEAARGNDANAFTARDEEVGKVWTTTYWPMAGSGDNNQEGNATSHLWAKSGPLAKLDQLLKARGMESVAKALEFERKPALGWLVGDRDTGHMINSSTVVEHDAELSTGVDFDGDGKITAGVKVDFLTHNDQFASVSNRNQLVPRATIDGNVVDVKRERVTGSDGAISFKFTRKDTGAELSGPEKATLFYANPTSGDGTVTGSMSVGWWGSCDKVALAGVLFKTPLKDSVTVDGVTFTKLDMLGLLTVIADSQANGTDFIGARYDARPDLLVKKDGKQLNGKFVGLDEVELRGGKGMWRHDGDFMVLTDPFKDTPDREFTFKEMNGTEHKIKASDIKHMAREDAKDISPAEFHATMLSWLSDGRAAAMDRDSGDHVWNYNFHGATLKAGNVLDGDKRPKTPGHNGNIGADTKVVEYAMDVRFGDSDWPREYKYWLEFDATGKAVNGGWVSENPDFLWRPSAFRNFTGANSRNPFVKPEFIKELYDKFMETT
jgi:hypothetical protein